MTEQKSKDCAKLFFFKKADVMLSYTHGKRNKQLQIHAGSTSTSSKAQSLCLSFESLPLGDQIRPSIMPVNWFILSPSAWSSRHPLWPCIISSILKQFNHISVHIICSILAMEKWIGSHTNNKRCCYTWRKLCGQQHPGHQLHRPQCLELLCVDILHRTWQLLFLRQEGITKGSTGHFGMMCSQLYTEKALFFAAKLPPCPSKTPKKAVSLSRSSKAECWKIA